MALFCCKLHQKEVNSEYDFHADVFSVYTENSSVFEMTICVLLTYLAVSTNGLYSYNCTKQVGTSSHTFDLYLGGTFPEF
jgi:hypothetical protein